MRERETPSDLTEESGRRRTSIIVWIAAVVVSFALGALVTHFALLQEPISQFSLQAFFASPFWTRVSIALVGFVLGIGFAYVPFAWYREDATRSLRNEYRDLRDKTDALREKTEAPREKGDAPRASPLARAAKPDEPLPEPPYAQDDEGPPDIAAVISEMSAAIKANLKEAGAPRPADVDLRRALGSKPLDK